MVFRGTNLSSNQKRWRIIPPASRGPKIFLVASLEEAILHFLYDSFELLARDGVDKRMYGGDKGEHDKTDDRLDLISSGFPGKVRAAIEPGDDVVDVGQRRRADDDGEAQKGAVLPHDAPLLAGQHGLVEARNRLALVAGLLEQVDVDSGGGELADGQMDHREVNDEARDSA